MNKPQKIDDYYKWLKDEHGIDLKNSDKNYYNAVAGQIIKKFSESQFWLEILQNLSSYHQEYYLTVRQKVLNCGAGFQPAPIYSAGKMPAPQYMTLQNVRLYFLPDRHYLTTRGYTLFSGDKQPDLLTKPYDSFLIKTFRKNIIDNLN